MKQQLVKERVHSTSLPGSKMFRVFKFMYSVQNMTHRLSLSIHGWIRPLAVVMTGR